MRKIGLRRILVLGLITVLAVGWYVAYRAVNQWYAPLLMPLNTVTYEMNARVPIGPEPKNILSPDGWEGYSYRVHEWEIVDTDAFLQEHQLSDPWKEDGGKPEKLLVVTATVANENNALKDFSLYQLDVRTELSNTFLSEELCAELNEGVEYPADIFIPVTEEVTLTLPYGLRRSEFSGKHWRNLEDQPFYMTCHVTNEGWEKRIVPLT